MIVLDMVSISDCGIAETCQGVKFMKIPRQGAKTSFKNLLIWTALPAILALILSLSGCGGGGGGTNGPAFSGNNPVINVIQPDTGSTAGGTVVTFFGANFESGVTVTFGGTAATSVLFVGSAQIHSGDPGARGGSCGCRGNQ